jgi:hypothetical protein
MNSASPALAENGKILVLGFNFNNIIVAKYGVVSVRLVALCLVAVSFSR